MWTSVDRWSCPVCHGTVILDLPDEEIPAAIRAAQLEHGAAHPAPHEPTTGARLAVTRRRAARARP